MKYGYNDYAVIFKALSDETRLKIVTMLLKGKTCACHILEEFNFTQPTLSYHMKQLTDSGLVEAQKDGKWVQYSLSKERLKTLCEFLSNINETENVIDRCCEKDNESI